VCSVLQPVCAGTAPPGKRGSHAVM
jgi:hypothetical protein